MATQVRERKKRAAEAGEYLPIRDYAIIGNCRTAALVGKNGSVDWYCPGRFDAPAVLSRILDAGRGGFLQVSPEGDWKSERRYLDDTNILLTTYRSDAGEVRVTDFMPMPNEEGHGEAADEPGKPTIVRRVEAVKGEASVRVRYRPRCNYGLEEAKVDCIKQCGLIAHCKDMYVGIAAPGADLEERDGCWEGTIPLHAGEHCLIALDHTSSRDEAHKALREPIDEDALPRTETFWRNWAKRCSYKGPYRDAVVRSALTLKLLTFNPTGSLVAAPTTSLPEDIGGVRNWDYRFTWLRDSCLILYALVTVNYDHEAARFLHWLEGVMKDRLNEVPQIMYTIEGGRNLTEHELTELDGYRGSRPVRVGNAAAKQVQLDIYGEVLTAAYVHYHRPEEGGHGLEGAQGEKPDPEAWRVLTALVDDAIKHWQDPDSGIWEVRGGCRDFLYSKLMCWAAVDRGIKIACEHGLEADLDRWKQTRDEMRHRIETDGYNQKLGAFVQSFGSDTLDAAALAIPRIGFLPATDPRMLSTIEQIQKKLTQDGLVYRYLSEDGLAGGEGTFLLCTFWLIEALSLAGKTDEARDLFEKTLDLANDLGLFSEELDPKSKAFLGNFPQGFTHLSLIRAAVDLAKAHEHGAEEHKTTEGERAQHAHRAASKS